MGEDDNLSTQGYMDRIAGCNMDDSTD